MMSLSRMQAYASVNVFDRLTDPKRLPSRLVQRYKDQLAKRLRNDGFDVKCVCVCVCVCVCNCVFVWLVVGVFVVCRILLFMDHTGASLHSRGPAASLTSLPSHLPAPPTHTTRP
jgi:hypothetical protein